MPLSAAFLGSLVIPEKVADIKKDHRAGQGETILVVDDEPCIRELIVEVLSELGYAALQAADGAEGLKTLESASRVDLLITDIVLPGGMNGRQFADAALTRAARIEDSLSPAMTKTPFQGTHD